MRHARHFATLTPQADLIAVSSPDQAELDAAQKEFGNLRTYLSYDSMLEAEPDLQAVIIASVTIMHAEQAIKAIEKGLHVLCEKPLSTSPEIVSSIYPDISLDSRFHCRGIIWLTITSLKLSLQRIKNLLRGILLRKLSVDFPVDSMLPTEMRTEE